MAVYDQGDNRNDTPLFRPDSIDLLFLGSFPDPFERVEMDKNKKQKEKRQKFA